MMALIYALAAALLMGLLFAYFYFSVLQSADNANIFPANIALLLFVNAVLVFSLILIWLENMPDNPPQSSLDKYIDEVKREEKIQSSTDEQLKPVLHQLNQISQSLALTNKTLNLGLERLSTRIDEVENASLDKVINPDNTIDQSEERPELSTIFNEELAKTLSELEIMKDK